MYIKAKLSNWHLKHNILWKIIVLHNRCINIFPEKCNLGQIPIASQAMCSERLKYFPVSSSTSSLESWNQNLNKFQCILVPIPFFIHNFIIMFSRDPHGSSCKAYCLYLAGKFLKNWLPCQIQQKNAFWWLKKGLTLTFTR